MGTPAAGQRSPWTGFLLVVGVVGVASPVSAWLLSYAPGWRLLLGPAPGLSVAFPSPRRFHLALQDHLAALQDVAARSARHIPDDEHADS
ncbi:MULTISPECIES: hypothetical protein [Streptomyces]|uniref:hypothetical protein n=1 Tax=Streptomyces TaxID=1883 RepID=UPI002554D2B0|nr:hypothetical protein [Streptomyces sp. NBRC 13847]